MIVRRTLLRVVCLALGVIPLAPRAAVAQSTAIEGRIVDEQRAPVPGAVVTVVDSRTGLTRTVVSDTEGSNRCPSALPVGTYDLTAELSRLRYGRAQQHRASTSARPFTLDFVAARWRSVAETVTVTGAAPLIETTSSVGRRRRRSAASRTCRSTAASSRTSRRRSPASGLGFHSDPTKSTQYSPQINGGNGRNVNYQIDGGDNNDDTVGGLLQLFPLEAIQEFNFVTSRYKAEYGRSNGGVMNIVTKSGTNLSRQRVLLFRDTTMNARTMTEKIASVRSPTTAAGSTADRSAAQSS